jgi:hypothetical protein
MGGPDQFAKRSFAEETERVSGGAAVWQDPPEIGLNHVQSDGMLVVRQPERLSQMVAPWCLAAAHDEVQIELKMVGDKLDVPAVERALLRRQARQVQRVEAAAREKAPWPKQEPLWLVAPHVPAWLRDDYELTSVARGCYRVGPARFEFLWLAANELPLKDELVTFLIARSGRALDEFVCWVAPQRSKEWVLDMLRYLPMTTDVREDLLKRFGPDENPVYEARTREVLRVMLETRPEVRQQIVEEGVEQGRLTEARAAVRRVLTRRGLALGPEDEARIEACEDTVTLERWHDQAVTAATVAEALR